MLRLTGQVNIGNYIFSAINEVKTESSWDMMTDVCTLKVPKKLKWKGEAIALDKNPLLKKGDKVSVRLGYNDLNEEVFQGYLTTIHADLPVRLDCEDAMWLLKQKTFKGSYRSVTLSRLFKDMMPPNIPYKITADYDCGMFRTFDNPTIAKLLSALKENLFIKFFFRNGILYAGSAYVPELQKEHVIKFNRDVTENNLEYVRKEDVKINLKCVIIDSANKKTEFSVGDSDGEVRTIHKYNISMTAMKQFAEAEIERLKYDGYRGTVKVFGNKNINHGDVCRFIDPEYTEHEGRYLVKKVTKEFLKSGYRNLLEIESKVS